MTEDEYGKHLDALIATLAGGTYMDPDTMAEKMVVGHKANAKVFVALRNMPKCGVTAAKLETALKRKARNNSAAEAAAERDARMQAILGCRPDTERAMVAAFLAQGNYQANFGGQFTRDGEVVPKNDLLIDIQLTAADLRLNHKPLELKDRNYERALIEFLSRRRAERLAEIIAMITEPLTRTEVALSDSTMLALFGWLFKEPAYAMASVKTVIWQIKRKMLRMEIKEPLFTVLYGKQKGGKSSFWRLLFLLIRDLTKNVDVSELVNEAQLDLYSYFVIDTDEMAKAERACLNKLKNIVTTETVTRRIYYTQSLADVRMCATLVGSSNMPVASLIQDVSGMRRFNQVDMRMRTPETEAHWDEFVRADFLSLWRSVDAEGEWPMLAFQDQLEAKQEGMRPIDRVEAWLSNFTFKPRIPPTLTETPQSFTPWSDDTVAYAAFELFTQSFTPFEERAFPGQHMTLGNWGVRFKALVDEGMAPEWAVETHGRRSVYYYALPAADEKTASQHAGVVVPMLPRRT